MLKFFGSIFSQLRANTQARHTAQEQRQQEAVRTGLLRWHCPGFKDVWANSKSEARARFKQELREREALTFAPAKVTRLPIGAKVSAASS